MGLLDSNVVRQETKSFNINGAATATGYVNGGGGIFDVSKFSIVCFQVKNITSGVVLKCLGGVTEYYSLRVVHNTFTSEIDTTITKAGTYYVDVSECKKCGFYVVTGVENGTVDIDVILKTTPQADEHRPLQMIATQSVALDANASTVTFNFTDSSDLVRYFKFVIAYVYFRNSADTANVAKESISLSTNFVFGKGINTYTKQKEETFNSTCIYTDWMPLLSKRLYVKVDFQGPASENDIANIELWGVR